MREALPQVVEVPVVEASVVAVGKAITQDTTLPFLEKAKNETAAPGAAGEENTPRWPACLPRFQS